VKNTFSTGSHTVRETNGSGYTASAWGGDCAANGTITLAFGDDKTCTITNDDVAPTLTLIKHVTNDNGGNAGANDFGLTIGGTAATSGTAYTLSSNTAYAINEAGLAGYTFVSITGTGCPAALNGTVTLNEGQNLTCTINNDDVAPTLTLRKVVVNDNGLTNEADEWTLTATGVGGFSGVGTQNPAWPGDQTQNNASKSASVRSNVAYVLSESGPAGYGSSGIWACTAGNMNGTTNSVTLDEGESATCTIVNNDLKFDGSGATVQHWILHDTVTLTLRAGGGAATVTFKEFDNASCDETNGSDPGGLVGTETVDVVAGVAATADGVSVSQSGTYYWLATYNGNQNNNPFTTGCGDEITQIVAKDDLPRDDFAEFG
jgi:hypothetical protein